VRVLQQQSSAEYEHPAPGTSFRATIDPAGDDAGVSLENAETDISPRADYHQFHPESGC
jgi:hypothetical protein